MHVEGQGSPGHGPTTAPLAVCLWTPPPPPHPHPPSPSVGCCPQAHTLIPRAATPSTLCTQPGSPKQGRKPSETEQGQVAGGDGQRSQASQEAWPARCPPVSEAIRRAGYTHLHPGTQNGASQWGPLLRWRGGMWALELPGVMVGSSRKQPGDSRGGDSQLQTRGLQGARGADPARLSLEGPMETEGRRQKLQQQERGSGAAGSSSRWGVGLSSRGPPAQPAPQYAHRLTSPTMTLQTPERALSGEPRAAGPRGPGPCPRGQVVSLPGLLGRMGGRPHESHRGTALTPGSGQGGSRGFGRFQALPLGPFLVERAAVPWSLATVTPTRAHLTPHGPHAKIEAQSAVPVQPGPSGEHIRPLAEGCLGPHFPVAPEQGFPQQGQAPHCICVGGIRHWPKASAPGVWATQGPSLRGWPLPSWGQQWGDTEDGGPSLHCRGAQWGGVEGLPLPQPLDPSRARPSHLAFCGPWASVRHARQLDSHLLACCPFPRESRAP